MGISFESPVAAAFGTASTKREKVTKAFGIRTVGDLMRHFPRRYVETGALSALEEPEEGQHLTLVGEVAMVSPHSYRDRRTGQVAYRQEVLLATDGVRLEMTFFAKKKHVADWWIREFRVGRRGLFMGQAKRFRDKWQLAHPSKVWLDGGDDDTDLAAVDAIGALYPIYPLTKGVDTWDLQRAITFARTVLDDVSDLVPPSVVHDYGLVDARTAYDQVHAPEDRRQVHQAQRHFRFEEALVTQLVLARRRRAALATGAVARDGGAGTRLAAFDDRLPFELTRGQREIGDQIAADLARPHPMNRLLQGEVGSGKTLVALRAMLRVVDSGGQCALLAPTEVLAQQHFRSISAMLGDLAEAGVLGAADEAVGVELLTGSMTKQQRKAPLLRLASGESGLVVGTHALLEDPVQFADLGLVVVDEQHRFGVEQRSALTDKAGSPPHVLVMTATPIPRTVAMTVFGDLETSTLRELPAGRAPIQTNLVDLLAHPGWFERVWQRVREEVGKGHQVYVVCPRIEADQAETGEVDQGAVDAATADDGEKPAAAVRLSAVTEVIEALSDGPLAGLRLAPMHGRLPADEKDATMRAFAAGDVDVLVSTTVIEVGVDVHNATTMVILDAERFGLSQLHQLRGRVGRGGLPGLCLLVSGACEVGSPAQERLTAMAGTTDGFELSRLDLEQRREGDVLGRSQSGWRSTLENLRVLRDEETIVQAREAAEALLDADPDLAVHPPLAEAVTDLEARAEADFLERS
ncbi:MAG: ATP-dependent DNA helicase RecG [Nocardioides sp.]|nr:ATP-dependent DNA helicase RecG [Nocardioides sp.]